MTSPDGEMAEEGFPPPSSLVVELIERGKVPDAISAYCLETGASPEQAQAVLQDQSVLTHAGEWAELARARWEAADLPDHAGFWVRFAALLVDGLVLAIPVAIVAYSLVGPLLAIWLYTALMMSSNQQGTLGMMALGLRITDEQGNRLSFGRATGRYFGSILSGIILCVGYLMLLGNERKQTLHDQMAGTLIFHGRDMLHARDTAVNYAAPLLEGILGACTIASVLALWALFAGDVPPFAYDATLWNCPPIVLFGAALLSRRLRAGYDWTFVLCCFAALYTVVAMVAVLVETYFDSYRSQGSNPYLCYDRSVAGVCNFIGALPLLLYLTCLMLGGIAIFLAAKARARAAPR